MYQNLINSLKKILDSKATQAEKLLKISTLVDFADGLQAPQPQPTFQPIPRPTAQKPNKPEQIIDAKRPTSAGPLLGVEDIK